MYNHRIIHIKCTVEREAKTLLMDLSENHKNHLKF